MERWKGRVALVTGASAGIGAGLCKALVQHGMTVVGCARNVDRIKTMAGKDDIKNAPGRLVAIKCDLTQESEILSMFDEIRRTLGRLDVCINNAGVGHNASLLTGSTAHLRNMLDVNVMALCICTQQALKLMQEKGVDDGQIIHISSIVGHELPSDGLESYVPFFYSGTKQMVRALTEGLRRELKATNSHIRVGSVCPGIVETEFFANYLKKPVESTKPFFKSFDPTQPKDIADSVLHILSAPPHVEVHDILVHPVENPV